MDSINAAWPISMIQCLEAHQFKLDRWPQFRADVVALNLMAVHAQRLEDYRRRQGAGSVPSLGKWVQGLKALHGDRAKAVMPTAWGFVVADKCLVYDGLQVQLAVHIYSVIGAGCLDIGAAKLDCSRQVRRELQGICDGNTAPAITQTDPYAIVELMVQYDPWADPEEKREKEMGLYESMVVLFLHDRIGQIIETTMHDHLQCRELQVSP